MNGRARGDDDHRCDENPERDPPDHVVADHPLRDPDDQTVVGQRVEVLTELAVAAGHLGDHAVELIRAGRDHDDRDSPPDRARVVHHGAPHRHRNTSDREPVCPVERAVPAGERLVRDLESALGRVFEVEFVRLGFEHDCLLRGSLGPNAQITIL